MAKIFCRLLVLVLLLALPASGSAQKSNSKEFMLSGNEIDLLVGTPTGVVEPLDTRRTRVDESVRHDFSNLLEDDFATGSGFEALDWSDAEDTSPEPEQIESDLLDLLDETGEIENLESTGETPNEELISTDNIETEFKL